MAYVSTLPADALDAEVFRKGSDLSVVLPVGYDDETDVTYSLVVGFSPSGGGTPEFYFYLVGAPADDGPEKAYWSGLDTDFIPKDDRIEIIRALQTLTAKILETEIPKEVVMITHDRDLPSKALQKHTLIARVFKNCGYKVHCADPYHGKMTWWMERLTVKGN